MKTNKSKSKKPVSSLRKRAGALLTKRMSGVKTEALSVEEARRLIHKLQTHQIKLEIQNEELRNTQLKLQESKDKYRSIFEGANDGIIACDLTSGKFLFVNKRISALTGYSEKEILRLGIKDLHLEKDLPYVLKEFNEIAAGEKTETRDIPVLKKDKSIIYCDIGSSFLDKTILIGFFRDVSERKQADEAVKESQRFILGIADATPNILYVFDLIEHNLVYVNSELNRTLGYYKEDIQKMGESLYQELIHPEDLLIVNELRRQNSISERGVFELEFRVKHVNGEWHWLSSRNVLFSRTDDGLPKLILGTAQDITERKRIEEELRRHREDLTKLVEERTAELKRSNEELRIEIIERKLVEETLTEQSRTLEAFFKHTITPLIFFDRNFNFIRVNEAYAKACQREISEFSGHNYFELYPHEENEAIFRRVVETKAPYLAIAKPFVFPEHPEWGVTYWDWTLVPIFDSNGEVDFLIFSLEDVTERKHAEEEILTLNKELEQRVKERTAELEAVNRELEAYSYTVSHDLRAPLRSIEGFIQAILEDYADRLDDTGKDYCRRVHSASHRMLQLIDALLTMARLTRRELKEKSVDLSSLAKVIAHDLRVNQPGRQVEFIIAEKVKAEGDTDMLRIALENLMNNAWKFTSKHPTARIEFGVNHPFNSPPNLGGEQGVVGKTVYFVRDDGAGFDMNFADKLFSPFRRLHNESEFPGIGIGLAIAQHIIRRHGGKIWAESEVEKGATFYFTLG